MRFYKIHT